jgi:hypothetical protein
MYAVDLADAEIVAGPFAARRSSAVTIGALMAAAEAVGAAGRCSTTPAATPASAAWPHDRSFQALRHLMADMYVRQASRGRRSSTRRRRSTRTPPRPGAWRRRQGVRAARGPGGGPRRDGLVIAVTAEHPAHCFLRRIVVREQQFGDAAHHERATRRAPAAPYDPALLASPEAYLKDAQRPSNTHR